MTQSPLTLDRRSFLSSLGLASAYLTSWPNTASAIYLDDIPLGNQRPKQPVAAIVTEYRPNSHADVLVGKILEGFRQDGGDGPDLQLVSLYVDQFPEADMSRALSEKHGFRLAKSIDEALTLGTPSLQVQGVLSIGEHGNYPLTADTRQQMYPRRRFFDEIVSTMDRCNSFVPVFNDKGLGYSTLDALHMVNTAREKQIPFMAGSSVPVAWRVPEEFLPKDTPVDAALTVGYSGIEIYGFHTLEVHLCQLERRLNGESGIRRVQAATGEQIHQSSKDGYWSLELLNAALAVLPQKRVLAKDHAFDPNDTFFLIEHVDGLRSCVAMLHGMGDEFVSAIKCRNETQPKVTWFQLENDRPYGHFAHLLRAIEHMIHSRKPAYPVERTLLATCILDRIMHSLAQDLKAYDTPELHISYSASDWQFARRGE